ncbi:Crp/Fnr family transcriptional regulator [Pedobacter sp.]
MDKHVQLLSTYLQSSFNLSSASTVDFLPHWEYFECARKVILTDIGERENYLYFVIEGVQRIYLLNPDGREATLIFTYAPSFGGVLDAMMTEQPSKFCYETLTPSSFLRIPVREVKKLMVNNTEISQMVNLGVSAALSGVLDRLAEIQLLSSEDKFKQLLSRSPHILTLVPHKYLASYLGIDPTNFSKLINRVKI